MNKEELIQFEKEVVELFNDGKLKSPIHLSGGNEGQLINIFDIIKKDDWVFSTYRSHYHALLKGIDKEWLKNWIIDNKSIHVMSSEHKFWTSAIVGGTLSIALGVALGIKMRQKEDIKVADTWTPHVWCFVGDMTGHTGVFWETIKYATFHNLPITFIIEDNGMSTDTPTSEAWNIPNIDYYNHMSQMFPGKLMYYQYERIYPHYGTNKFVSKLWEEVKK